MSEQTQKTCQKCGGEYANLPAHMRNCDGAKHKPQVEITPNMDQVFSYKGPESLFVKALRQAKWVWEATRSVQATKTPDFRVVQGPGDLPVAREVVVETQFDGVVDILRHETNTQGRYLRLLGEQATIRSVKQSESSEVVRVCKR